MFTFRTSSGSLYRVHNGRITRLNGTPEIRNGHGEVVLDRLDNAIFGWDVKPEVGRRAVFTVKGMSECIRTSRVTEVNR